MKKSRWDDLIMANPETVKRAFFKVEGAKDKVEVHFNPESLQYTISNTLKNTGKGNSKKQYISESTGKLNLDLIFDSTATGEDVRLKTIQIAKFMEPTDKGNKTTPPVVNFEWGMYKFKGMVESYKETIDFFSANGVPLRASTSISMSGQDAVFEGGSKTTGSPDVPNTAIPASADTGKGKGTTEIATKAGNPAAAKDIAAKNGVENMRFPGSTPLEIDESFSFKGPAAFASGSIGLNASAGAGLNLGATASGGLNLDASASLSAGASASAGVSASAGAFNGLHAISNTSASTNLSLEKFIDTDLSAKLGLDASSIAFGGGAALQGSASFKAEVGKAGELKAKLEFDGG
jgi:hypothetical protein